ncbi:nitrile hydratase subunit beta [Shimia abyssi]|uniref:Nitrile hydratase subunit beta n=1 Tax=Shimia abyssi TaxID=1662395 RepID=A0A2P8FJ86_9RHOB|nr:nitrile hydratase subunit beta [Shimia abyssi]PSL21759.1 nitrile hydratase [Shimia abyssi]
MSRVHDMGGRYGDGPVNPEDGAIYAEDWHARALALTLAAGALGQWNIDTSRHARETLPPKDYSRFTYYEKWMAALANLLVERDMITLDELQNGHARGQAPSDLVDRALRAEVVAGVLASGSAYDRLATPPDFAIGDRVRTRKRAHNATVPGGHTRLPSYAAGAVGEVVLRHGAFVLPDTNAHGQGEAPEPLYAVSFSACDLWGDEGSATDEVILDLWQSYLEPA